jgi:hypothetical protein
MWRPTFTVPLIAICLCNAVACVESNHLLAPDSRLPRWFASAAVGSREDYSVELVSYTGGRARMYLRDKHGRLVAEMNGDIRPHPKSVADNYAYPGYQVMVTDIGIEVIEFRTRGPIFYICDQPDLVRQAVE